MAAEAEQKERDRQQQWQLEVLKINANAQAKQQELGMQREMHGEKLAHDERTAFMKAQDKPKPEGSKSIKVKRDKDGRAISYDTVTQ